jgi:hypothetical protein
MALHAMNTLTHLVAVMALLVRAISTELFVQVSRINVVGSHRSIADRKINDARSSEAGRAS